MPMHWLLVDGLWGIIIIMNTEERIKEFMVDCYAAIDIDKFKLKQLANIMIRKGWVKENENDPKGV